MTDFLSAFTCVLGCSMGSCPRNGLDLLIYSACVSWPSSPTHPMTKCVFHFKTSLVALDSKMAASQHTCRCRQIHRWIHWLGIMTHCQ